MRTMKDRPVFIIVIATFILIGLVGVWSVGVKQPRDAVPAIEWDAATVNVGALPTGTYAVDGGNIVVLGAVIRLGPGGPYIHENDSHANVGIASVGMSSSGDLTVTAPRPAGAQIIAATAAGDETLARLGIMCGVSGGVSQSNVLCYRDGSKIRANASIYGNFGNIWYTQVMFVPDGA